MPSAVLVRSAGTNCDAELARALVLAGARVDLVHLDEAARTPDRIEHADIIAFPGGFTYGDDIASGRIFAARLRHTLYPALRRAVDAGALIIGVCNGFQILVQAGLLPGPEEDWQSDSPPPPGAALVANAGARFIDRWVRVRFEPDSVCLWTRGLGALAGSSHADDVLRLPIAHGQGRFIAPREMLDRLEARGMVALRYAEDVNGSARSIAGICDRTGRVLGLMPHPERYLDWTAHPFWTRLDPSVRAGDTPGLTIFRNAVRAAAGAPA